MELNNCKHSPDVGSPDYANCDCMQATFEHVIYHFHGTLTKLSELVIAATICKSDGDNQKKNLIISTTSF